MYTINKNILGINIIVLVYYHLCINKNKKLNIHIGKDWEDMYPKVSCFLGSKGLMSP